MAHISPFLNKSRFAGLTLLEILAAIFLFAVMTLGISSTMKETNSLARKIRSRESKTMSAVIALDRFQKDTQMAFNDRLQNTKTYFKMIEGSLGSELTFTYLDTPVKTLFQRRTPGVMIASYKLEKEENGTYKLLRTEAPYYSKDKLNEAPSQTLASGVLSFKCETYDHRNDRWLKAWDTAGLATNGYFPKAVRVRIETIDPDLPKAEWKEKSMILETDTMVLNELETR